MNNERFAVPELLFRPSDVGVQEMGITEALIHAVESTPQGKHINTLSTTQGNHINTVNTQSTTQGKHINTQSTTHGEHINTRSAHQHTKYNTTMHFTDWSASLRAIYHSSLDCPVRKLP